MPSAEDRFYAEDRAIRGRAGILDRKNGDRLVCFFFADPACPEHAPRMARVCARALNLAVTKPTQGSLTDG